ncbi:MHYT domain-containing protein [Rhizobium grahamii]|uniref:PAS domain-containing protein n=1 Tax=Rhizobium grahamii TaxID=1120045 RepID=UPI003D7C20A1
MAATTAATACATFLGQRAYVAAGLLFGLGISSMHFTGMAAIEFPGDIAFDRTLVICAIVIAVALAIPAFHLACGRAETDGAHHPKRRADARHCPHALYCNGRGDSRARPCRGLPGVRPVADHHDRHDCHRLPLAARSRPYGSALCDPIEKAVAAGEKSFRLLVQGVTDYAIYMLDRDGRVANWNAGAQRAKGYVASEIVGKHFSEFYPHEDRVAGLPERGLETALRDGKFESEGGVFERTEAASGRMSSSTRSTTSGRAISALRR